MTTPLLEGFPPVVDDAARLLILGSFPSVQSLSARQYYGNPRNAFWPITSALGLLTLFTWLTAAASVHPARWT
jgi:hypoxanthine-DNA glycosylase